MTIWEIPIRWVGSALMAWVLTVIVLGVFTAVIACKQKNPDDFFEAMQRFSSHAKACADADKESDKMINKVRRYAVNIFEDWIVFPLGIWRMVNIYGELIETIINDLSNSTQEN